jgi:hypothetical protein
MMWKSLKRTMSNTLDFISIAALPGTHTFFSKRKQLGLSLTNMYWLLGRKSKLSINNKLLIYKVIIKPIWTLTSELIALLTEPPIQRRLRRYWPHDLLVRF